MDYSTWRAYNHVPMDDDAVAALLDHFHDFTVVPVQHYKTGCFTVVSYKAHSIADMAKHLSQVHGHKILHSIQYENGYFLRYALVPLVSVWLI